MKGFRVLCLIFCVCFPLFSYDLDAPVSFPRKESEPDGLDPDILINAWGAVGTPYEIEQYGKVAIEKQKIFFNTLETAITPKNKDILLGYWVLQDEAGNNVSPYRLTYWCQRESFDVIEAHGWLNYVEGSENVIVHYSKQGEFYISKRWDNGIIKQLKLVNDRLYVYVLIIDEWVMDPMHAYGKYSYVKHSPRNLYQMLPQTK
jgi:hypothetical protein